MAIAIPGAKLYTREVNFAISQCAKNSRRAAISKELRQELEHWRFYRYATWRQKNVYRYPLQQMHHLSATVFLSCQERRNVYLLGIFGQTQMIDLFEPFHLYFLCNFIIKRVNVHVTSYKDYALKQAFAWKRILTQLWLTVVASIFVEYRFPCISLSNWSRKKSLLKCNISVYSYILYSW